jgi:hypothetical protein
VSKSEQKEIQVEVRMPRGNYPKVMYFNRFRVDKEDGFSVVHFGLVGASGLIQDYYCCVFMSETLKQNKQSLVDYLTKLGALKGDLPTVWQVALPGHKTEVADIISMAHRSGIAEIGLSIFSLISTLNVKPDDSKNILEAQPLALLRSDVETQKQLIADLYAD